jgi:hypothetical protein
MSAFFKAGGGTVFPVLRFNGNTTNAYAGCVFNTTTGQVVNTFSNTYTGTTTKVDNVGNGWYRVSLTTTTNETTFGVRIASSNTATPTVGAFGAISYAGNTNNFFYAWGAMLEAGAYGTSYVKTEAAAVTRLADAASKTGISSLIGQTEGTIFLELQKNAGVDSANMPFSLSDGSSANLIYWNLDGGVAEFIASGSTQAIKTGITLAAGTNKIAFYYKANDFGIYLNGVSIFTDTSGSVGAMSKFNLGSFFNDAFPVGTPINQALLFKTRLTNAQLAELTTL